MSSFTLFATTLFVLIDGSLQNNESHVIVVSHGVRQPLQVAVTYILDEHGFEFDPRAEVGSERRFTVTVVAASGGHVLQRMGEGSPLVRFRAKVASWAIEKDDPKKKSVGIVRATVTFEEAIEEPIEEAEAE